MRKILLIIISLFFLNCSNSKIKSFYTELEKIEGKYAPDKSIAIFDVELVKKGANWQLKGETTSVQVKEAVLLSTKSILDNTKFQDSLIVLPYPDLGADTLAIVNVSVANLRRNPSVGAELVDQVIMGDMLRVLKKNRSFYLVQTEYGYLGWVTGYSIEQKLAESVWFKNPMCKVIALNSYIYSEPDTKSEIVCDIILNSKVNLISKVKNWLQVTLPDGRTGFIQNFNIINTTDVQTEISVEKLIATAKSMMGVPYLWGGNSSKMNDCSGFTLTVFLANGLQLPRDARQQALIGETIEFDSTFQNLMPGDLLFFGSDKIITHVGISLGGYDFIQQDGYVMINSFDKNDANYSEHRKNGLQIIKRVI